MPPELQRDITAIRQHVQLEVRLIDDLVDLTGISHGKMTLVNRAVDVHASLSAAVEVCRSDVQARELQLHLSPVAHESIVLGDPIRLQQVFWNLLRNAIKFTPPGGHISVTTANDRAGHIEIVVSDDGIGVDPAHLTSIFRAFEQGPRDVQTCFGGLGLGLAICQALVEAHGGTISASSEGNGRGSTFRVELPLCSPPTAASTGDTSEAHSGASSRRSSTDSAEGAPPAALVRTTDSVPPEMS